jgi:hypothetical protein
VISRVISAPRELVFEAFTEVRHLSRWWGPEGFTTTRAFEFRVGGEWDFVMHGPDGTINPAIAGSLVTAGPPDRPARPASHCQFQLGWPVPILLPVVMQDRLRLGTFACLS